MKTLTFIATLLLSSVAIADEVSRFATPDENQASCVATPAELARHPNAFAAVQTFGGIQSVVGTWKLTGIPFAKGTISFSYDQNGFYVQNEMDTPEPASLCAQLNTRHQVMLRVAIHTPACPETKNIYVRAVGSGVMMVTAYATRQIGSAKFKRKSAVPMPPGKPTGLSPRCAARKDAPASRDKLDQEI